MRSLILAERELRAAARRKGTFILRWTSGLAFFVFFIWLMWAVNALTNPRRIHEVFMVFSVVVFFYCLLVGAIRTADCISSERREGTLGLLFLTNLNSLEIVAGKLLSNAMPAVYGLLAIFPLLGMPLLMGGVTALEFGKVLLAILVAILLALACGISASVICRRQFPAVAAAVGLALLLGAGPFLIAAMVDQLNGPAELVFCVSVISPLYSVCTADGGNIFNANLYWPSIGGVTLLALVMLANATFMLARSWQDRVKAVQTKPVAGAAKESWLAARMRAGREQFRKTLLDRNAFYWLTARRSPSAPVFVLVVGLLVLLTQYGTVPAFISLFGRQREAVELGTMFGWLWTGLAVHLMALYYAGMISANALAEDKQSGALELIFSTPVSERAIHRGLWRAFIRRMFFPALAAGCVHGYFIWLVLSMMLVDPGTRLFPRGTTHWQVFWHSLLDVPFGSSQGQFFFFVMMMRTLVGILVFAFLLWWTLGYVGRWLGLRMKHPGFAPLVALALLVIPPTLCYSLFCFIADQARWLRGNERNWLPLMVMAAFAFVAAHCLILAGWARRRLRDEFRSTVIGRYDVPKRTWAEKGKRMAVLGVKSAGFAAAMACVVFSYNGCRDYKSRRAWENLQAELKRQNVPLDVARRLPPPAPDTNNFAKAATFESAAKGKNTAMSKLLDRLQSVDDSSGQNSQTYRWITQERAPLGMFNLWLGSVPSQKPRKTAARSAIGPPPVQSVGDENAKAEVAANLSTPAGQLLARLQPVAADLDGLAAAARRPFFQPTTNRTVEGLFKYPSTEVNQLVRIHFLFNARSAAHLASGDSAKASDDFLTGLELLRLARQLPDMGSQSRSQLLLLRSLQPLWEGLIGHQWNDQQLGEFEAAMAPLNPITDFTNAVQQTVLLHMQVFQLIPDEHPDWASELSSAYEARGASRSWWLENGVRMHQLGKHTLTRVDAQLGRINERLDWNDTSGLPMARKSTELFQMVFNYWSQAGPQNLAYAQTALNQARAAIALERHRLANGKYPSALSEIVPTRLKTFPLDVEVGRPLRYQWKTNDAFELRGVGQDRSFSTNNSSDDWVWSWPKAPDSQANE